jgi:hypothetical protein
MEEWMENIKQNLKDAQDRKRTYAYKNGVFIDFKMDEDDFLKAKEKQSSLILGSFSDGLRAVKGVNSLVQWVERNMRFQLELLLEL